MAFLKFKQEEFETRVCEVCGQKFVADYGYSLALCWLVTGHAHIAAFMCEEPRGQQHWGCSPEHALQAALVCAKEHMPAQLNARYSDAAAQKKPRISPEHAALFEESDPHFHFIK